MAAAIQSNNVMANDCAASRYPTKESIDNRRRDGVVADATVIDGAAIRKSASWRIEPETVDGVRSLSAMGDATTSTTTSIASTANVAQRREDRIRARLAIGSDWPVLGRWGGRSMYRRPECRPTHRAPATS